MRQRFWRSLIGGSLSLGLMAWASAIPAQAAVGGAPSVTTTTTVSNTTSNHHTRVDIADAHTYQTRVLGYVSTDQGASDTYNRVYAGAYDSELRTIIRQDAGDAAMALPGRCNALHVGEPSLVGSSDTRGAAVQVGTQFTGNTTDVTTQTTFGPSTILIGEDQSQTFFVAAGTMNINTHTHVANFFNDLFQATVTHESTYEISAQKVVSPLILDLTGSGTIQASGGAYLPHPGKFHFQRRVLFDFFANGFPVAMEWVGPQDGLLCVPKPDGKIDGTCLFGTSSGYETGFEQLASLDVNMDYKVDGNELAGLMVWQDKNGNARGEQGELTSVQDLGITELSVKNTKMVGSYKMKGQTYKMFDWWPTVMQLKKVNWKPAV